jgi:uncharacterized phage protein (TIGR02218 family)
MKTSISPALKAHYAQGSTTISRQWRLERVDGFVKTVTTCSRNLLIGGELYEAKDGVNPMALQQGAYGSVQNTEINGTLSPDFATEEEIVGGLWDNTFVTVFEVNYRDLTMGTAMLFSGWIGKQEVGRSTFKAELRSLAQAMQQMTGRIYGPLCPAQLGDEECQVDVESMRFTSTLTAVTSRRTFTDTAAVQASDWFGAGLFRVEEGEYAGMQMEVYSFSAGVYVLALPLPFDPTIGMAYSVLPGCRKRHERGARNPAGTSDCIDKFNNIINFRGFPPSMFPGNNRIIGLGSMTEEPT